MKIRIFSAALLVLAIVSPVSAQEEQKVDPIGLNSLELSTLREVFRAPVISEWFRQLSEPSQRVLTDVSTSLVVLWPDGRMQYRAGLPLAGNRFYVASAVASREDYTLLLNSLAEPDLYALMEARRSLAMRREAPNVFASSYRTILDIPDPTRRQTFMALLGELQTRLESETLLELRSINPSAVAEPMSALSKFGDQKLDNIREGRFEVIGLTGQEDWDVAIRDGMRGLQRDSTTLEYPVELEPGLHGFLRLSPGASLNHADIEELVSRDELELFIGPAASPEVRRVQPTDFNQMLQRAEPVLDR